MLVLPIECRNSMMPSRFCAWVAHSGTLMITLFGFSTTCLVPIAAAISRLNGSSDLNAMFARASPAAKDTRLTGFTGGVIVASPAAFATPPSFVAASAAAPPSIEALRNLLREFRHSVVIGFHLSVHTIQVNSSPAELAHNVIQITEFKPPQGQNLPHLRLRAGLFCAALGTLRTRFSSRISMRPCQFVLLFMLASSCNFASGKDTPSQDPIVWGRLSGNAGCVIFAEGHKTKGMFWGVAVTTQTTGKLTVIEAQNYTLDKTEYLETQDVMDDLMRRAQKGQRQVRQDTGEVPTRIAVESPRYVQARRVASGGTRAQPARVMPSHPAPDASSPQASPNDRSPPHPLAPLRAPASAPVVPEPQ